MRFQFPNLAGRVVAADGEATGLSWFKDELFGIGLAFRNDQGALESHYFDLRHPEVRAWAETAFAEVKLWVNHYIKYDMHMFREAGILYPRKRVNCTMIREAIIDENKYEYGLDLLGNKYLGRGKRDVWPRLAAIFGGAPTKDAQIQNLYNAPEAIVAEYAREDAAIALEVWEAQEKVIAAEDLHRVHALEMRLLPVIVELERFGVRVDLDQAMQAHKRLNTMVWEEQRKLDRLVGRAVNANSPVETKKILKVHQRDDGEWYTGDGIKLEKNEPSDTEVKKAKAEGRDPVGTPSLDSIKMQQCKLPEAEMIVNIRGWCKARDTMIEKYMLEMNHEGYVHASFNQTRTEDGNGIYTGRISISEPALQQIHKRNKKLAAIVRACFVPDEGYAWGCYDWSQMDFRIFAHFLNDLRINAMYEKDPYTDFHGLVASLTGLPRDRDQKTGGANAKQINLACVFGMGAGELAKQCNLPYTVVSKKGQRSYLVAGPDAKNMFGLYHGNIPGVKKLQQSVESVAKKRGYITTQVGRRIRFPRGYNSHKAAGLLYQATAADAMKLKMCELFDFYESLPDSPCRLMLTVHDEFNSSMHPDYVREYGLDTKVRDILQRFDGTETPMQFRIPIISDFALDVNWHEASK